MKKFIIKLLLVIVVAIGLCFSLTGCKEKKSTKVDNYDIANFECLCKHDKKLSTIMYYVDTDTDLIYVYYYTNYDHSCDGFSLYYNKDGKPMTLNEFERAHMKEQHREN